MTIKHGYLADYFKCFGFKLLKPVEIDPSISNEHEFNGINAFKEVLGQTKQKFSCNIVFLSDDEEEILYDTVELTWYDARENHPYRSEYRLYYTDSDCFLKASKDDLMILCRGQNDSFEMFIAKSENTVFNQLVWLFGISSKALGTTGKVDYVDKNEETTFVSEWILEKIGIQITQKDDIILEQLLNKYPAGFPSTSVFSSFARSYVNSENRLSGNEIDKLLIEWLDVEERLFRLYESHLVQKKLRIGFVNVDEFISFSLSVQNRRKVRAGYALENHLKYIFSELEVQYSYNPVTENKSRPDFLFPNITAYNDSSYPESYLTMMGVKTSCKDRWRQVLSEAKKIKHKHLCTLEPSISKDQTNEMEQNNLRLVVPFPLYSTYTEEQQKWLMSISDFIQLVKSRQQQVRR